MSEEDDLLAAELALGLNQDHAAQARKASDPAFAARIQWWEQHFAGLTVPLAQQAAPDLWPRIAAALPQNDNADSARRWKIISGAMAGVAAVALFLAVVQRPQDAAPPRPGAPAVASLAGDRGNALAISYDGQSHRLTVAPVRLDPGKGDAELWVIPVGSDTAVSLGVIDARQPRSHQLTDEQARLVAPGAVFAISLEPLGGSPTGKATGPIVAKGTLIAT